MASFWVEDEDQPLFDRILKYKVGNYEKFNDALPGEMDGFRLNIVLFSMAGCGQSSLINTIFKCLDLAQPAVINNTGREITASLESHDLPNDVTIHGTKGFFDLNEVEQV